MVCSLSRRMLSISSISGPVKTFAACRHQLVAGLRRAARRSARPARRRRAPLPRSGRHRSASKRPRDDLGQRHAARGLLDARLLLVVELLVEPREAAGERADGVLVAHAHHHAHREVLERHGGLGDERLAGGLERLGDADGIDDDVVGLGGRAEGVTFFRSSCVERARAAALHLLEVVRGSSRRA